MPCSITLLVTFAFFLLRHLYPIPCLCQVIQHLDDISFSIPTGYTMSTDPGPSSRSRRGSDEEEGRNNDNINIIHHEPTLPSQDAQDPELAPPRDETTQDEADLFSVRRPIIVSPERTYSSLEYLTSLSLLGILSFFGTLIRLGLVALGTYDGQSIFPLLWAQMVGCCLMGMFTVRKRCIEEM